MNVKEKDEIKETKPKKKNILLKLFMGFSIKTKIIILLVMTSRVYLGVHYFTDVCAGCSLSIIWLLFYTEYLDKKKVY